MKLKSFLLIFLLAAAGGRAQTNNFTTLLQAGLFEEQANRNLDAAIADYRSIVVQFDKDRPLAATAVFRLGECYRLQGKTNEATLAYQQLLREFPDQKDLATLSRQNIVGLGGSLAEISQPGTAASAPTDEEDKAIRHVQDILQNSPDLINASNTGNDTLMGQAVAKGQLRVAAFLLDHGADINQWCYGGTPLILALHQKPMLELLLNRGANIEANDSKGNTALLKATRDGLLTTAELLLAHKANVNGRSANVNGPSVNAGSPLNVAAAQGYANLVSLLLTNGADVNAVDWAGATPLHLAARSGQIKIVQQLLAAGAKPNAANRYGQTPLYSAVWSGSLETLELLLTKGANPNAKDNDGNTALHCLAGVNGIGPANPAMAKLLLERKADPNLQNNQGKTLLDLLKAILAQNATAMDNRVQFIEQQKLAKEMADLLRQHGARDDPPDLSKDKPQP